MPQLLENKLRFEAKKKFPSDQKRQDEYVYGNLRRRGWKPQQEQK